MPDQPNTNQPNPVPTPTGPVQDVTPVFQTIPADGGAPPPPPMTQQTDQTQEAAKEEQKTQIITPKGPGRKKLSKNGKIIATILGILFLVGGIGAGVILVQQQQELREKAGGCWQWTGHKCIEPYCSCSCSGGCVAVKNETGCGCSCPCNVITPTSSPPSRPACNPNELPDCGGFNQGTCCGGACDTGYVNYNGNCVHEDASGLCSSNSDCPAGKICSGHGCVNPPSGTTTPTVGENEYCILTCHFNSTPDQCSGKYTILGSNCGYSPGYCEQVDRCITGTTPPSCSVVSLGPCEPGTPTSPPSTSTPSPPPGVSAQCLEVRAYDINWGLLAAADLAGLKAGESIYLTVHGSASAGNITKGRFTINGDLMPETALVKSGSSPSEFYYEYAIPEGVSSFSIKGEIYHSTKGWL